MVKIKWVLIIALGFLSALPSCSRRGPAESDEILVDKVSAGQELTIDFCSLKSKSIDSIAKLIIQDKEQVTVTSMRNEDCVIDIINDLTKIPSLEHFQSLEILASKSDGSLSEYMMDVTVRLLENNNVQFVEFLSINRNALFQSLIDGLSMKLSVEKIGKDDLKRKYRSKLTTDLQKETLDKIFSEVDAAKFD